MSQAEFDPQASRFERYTLRKGRHGFGDAEPGVDVLGWGTYPASSVLAGQPMKVFLGNFPNEVAAREAYPLATQWSHPLLDPQVSLDHLPGPDDPVPGGMYPDDWPDSSESESSSDLPPQRTTRRRP